MFLYDALVSLMPWLVINHDAGANEIDGRQIQDYIVAWLTVNAVKK